MDFCRFFISRPVATTILSLSMLIFGIFAYPKLPINELPNVDFPTIVVSASLPGADPETIATTVAKPIEKQLSTIAGIDSMSSVSSTGSTRITIQFNLDRNIDAAAQDVQSALSQVTRQLPEEMDEPPSLRKVNPADAPILIVALTAKNLKLTDLNQYAENYISPRLSVIPGVAQVNVFGAQNYAVRIPVNPNALTSRNLTMGSVADALRQQNSNLATGTLQTDGFYRLIKVDGQLKSADEFANAVVASKDGALVRLQDIGKVMDSVQNDKAMTWFNDQRAIVLAIQRQPGANTVEVANTVLKELPSITRNLPGEAKVQLVFSRASFIEESIKDVELTLLFAAVLVIFIIFLFLKNLSSTVIAVFSLPLSIIATFAFMYLLGFSLNNLSLMALILCVGFVIDDAVVVLENIMRHVEMGKSRLQASLDGSSEIGFTVISMTISLSAVFIPIFFMPGIIGRLFHEFAAVVGIAIMISGVVALTLIPMLCSRFVNSEPSQLRLLKQFERAFNATRTRYMSALNWSVQHVGIMVLFSIGILIATAGLFAIVQKGFIPSEDIGVIFADVQAPEGIVFNDFFKLEQQAAQIILKNPNVKAMVTSIGQGQTGAASSGSGRFIIHLKPSSQRELKTDEVIQQLRKQLQVVPQIRIYMTNPPAIRMGGRVSRSQYQYVLQGTDWKELETVADQMQKRMEKMRGINDIDSDLQLMNPQINLRILRDKAAQLGVTPTEIQTALFNAFGIRRVTNIMNASGDYDVLLYVDEQYQKSPSDLDAIYVRSNTSNQLVPISVVTERSEGVGPLSINHTGQLPSVTLSFNLATGVSLSQATKLINQAAEEILPPTISGAFSGSAQSFEQSMADLPILLLFTVLVIYMVLAVLYEHFWHPITILTALPFAAFGAAIALVVCHVELNLFGFIGLVMLVGITKKNGIIMVDFALSAQREKGISASEAILEACHTRFRPIMMTTFAAIVATFPIALGIGAGGEARKALGIAVVGGLVFSQLITLFITPIFYVLVDRYSSSNSNIAESHENRDGDLSPSA